MRMKSFALAAVLGLGFAAPAMAVQNIALNPTDIVRGNPNAPVTVVEYASMTCPHCAAFDAEVLPALAKEYIDTGKVKYVFREFPLDAAARMASSLARCFKGEQYYAFVDLLYRNQATWWVKLFDNNHQVTKEDVEASLAAMARNAGMSHDAAVACENDPKNLAIVDANWHDATDRYKINSTPTFLINGQQVGPNSTDMAKVRAQFEGILNPLVGK